MNENTKLILESALSKIIDPVNWIQAWFAADRYGNRVLLGSPDQCKFCALGALYSTVGTSDQDPPCAAEAYMCLFRAAGSKSIAVINDSDGHEAVIGLYNKAIESCEADGSFIDKEANDYK